MSFIYVEMKYHIKERPINLDNGYEIVNVNTFSQDELYELYLEAFLHGDAEFFFNQDKKVRNDYYNDELGLPEALKRKESHAITYNGELIGFLYCIQYGDKNIHISCMCVKPSFQGQGIGTLMLDFASNKALEEGMETISLGTELNMKAYQLYKKYGFEIVNEHHIGQ